MVIQTMIENMLPIIMIMFTLVMIYVYMRIAMKTLIMKTNQMNWSLKLSLKINKMSISLINFISMTSLYLATML